MLLINVIVSKKTRYEVYCAAVDLKGELAVTYIFGNNQYFFIICANTIFHKYSAFNLSSKPVAPFFKNSGSASDVTL